MTLSPERRKQISAQMTAYWARRRQEGPTNRRPTPIQTIQQELLTIHEEIQRLTDTRAQMIAELRQLLDPYSEKKPGIPVSGSSFLAPLHNASVTPTV